MTKRSNSPASTVDGNTKGEQLQTASPSSIASLGRKRLGRYEIIYPIAQGGMAAVYAGRLTGIAGFQRLVAIKVIHPHLSSDEDFVKMFLDEARLSAGIHHPNVGEVFEVGEDDGLYFMVCELITGQSLSAFQRHALHNDENIPPEIYAKIASITAQALHAAHSLKTTDGAPMRLVHRDVSPRNILITYDGFVKLIDFGVAYAHNRLASTDVGTVKGKLGFMSPEQLKSYPLDGRSDIFSLGVVLYQNLTNQSPFYGNTELERIDKILNHQFDPPRAVVPSIPKALESIIFKAMAYRPIDRYPNGNAMSADLEGFIRSADTATDANALSRIMHRLFHAERKHHLLKIRELGDNEIRKATLQDPETTKNIRKKKTRGKATSTQSDAASDDSDTTSAQNDIKSAQRNKASLRAAIDSFKRSPILKSIVIAGSVFVATVSAYFIWTNFDFSSKPKPENYQTKEYRPISQPKETNFPSKASDRSHDSEESTSASLPRNIKITLDIYPPVAQFELDGKLYSTEHPTVEIPSDDEHHRLRVFAEDYIPHTATFLADRDQTISIKLNPIPKLVQTNEKHKNTKRKSTKTKQGSSKSTKSPNTAKYPKKSPYTKPASKNPLKLEKSPYR